jgi:hypothetical protein
MFIHDFITWFNGLTWNQFVLLQVIAIAIGVPLAVLIFNKPEKFDS